VTGWHNKKRFSARFRLCFSLNTDSIQPTRSSSQSVTFVDNKNVQIGITDFYILQDRIDEAWAYLDANDQWYKEFIEKEKNREERLSNYWLTPYYLRKNKVSMLLGLEAL